ncbi:hypothetical protein GGE50_002843 [Rhizobium leguminosarum]|jgi:hypothetical protein|nr:hypothetical protein [Rhizobium leguminosarum]MDH6662639.1 hypothetical protein [Rhizobium sophorae]MBB4339634.1 hypothetical protein [Rhizobium leguminosarum]MBB4355681.1 hypothetical protein [Rhizobium leguminosarum]MBB4386006.1 hypothetical protein [Rhizobium leguminosarum]
MIAAFMAEITTAVCLAARRDAFIAQNDEAVDV